MSVDYGALKDLEDEEIQALLQAVSVSSKPRTSPIPAQYEMAIRKKSLPYFLRRALNENFDPELLKHIRFKRMAEE
jgi:hypothetical protein